MKFILKLVIAVLISLMAMSCGCQEELEYRLAELPVRELFEFAGRENDPLDPDSNLSKMKPIATSWPTSPPVQKQSNTKIIELNGDRVIIPENFAEVGSIEDLVVIGNESASISMTHSLFSGESSKINLDVSRSKFKERLELAFDHWNSKPLFDRILDIYSSEGSGLAMSVPFEQRMINLYLLAIKSGSMPIEAKNGIRYFRKEKKGVFLFGPLRHDDGTIQYHVEAILSGLNEKAFSLAFRYSEGGTSHQIENRIFAFLELLKIKTKERTEPSPSL